MTSILGKAIVAKTMTSLCDGQCGGTIEVTTDGVHSAYVRTIETEGRWMEGDESGGVIFNAEAFTIEGTCGSQHDRTLNYCTGGALFGRADFDAAAWHTNGLDLTPMDRA